VEKRENVVFHASMMRSEGFQCVGLKKLFLSKIYSTVHIVNLKKKFGEGGGGDMF
jgi:hypothetical protein